MKGRRNLRPCSAFLEAVPLQEKHLRADVRISPRIFIPPTRLFSRSPGNRTTTFPERTRISGIDRLSNGPRDFPAIRVSHTALTAIPGIFTRCAMFVSLTSISRLGPALRRNHSLISEGSCGRTRRDANHTSKIRFHAVNFAQTLRKPEKGGAARRFTGPSYSCVPSRAVPYVKLDEIITSDLRSPRRSPRSVERVGRLVEGHRFLGRNYGTGSPR